MHELLSSTLKAFASSSFSKIEISTYPRNVALDTKGDAIKDMMWTWQSRSAVSIYYTQLLKELFLAHFHTSSSSWKSVIFCLCLRRGAKRHESGMKKREMFIAHKISTLLFIFWMSFTPYFFLYIFAHTSLFLPPSIDETWFEYISRDLFPTWLPQTLTSYHDRHHHQTTPQTSSATVYSLTYVHRRKRTGRNFSECWRENKIQGEYEQI